jgi:hypothetical protein
MALVALLGLGLAGYIVGPPLYWHVAEAVGRSTGACPACVCDCDALPLLSLPEGTVLSVPPSTYIPTCPDPLAPPLDMALLTRAFAVQFPLLTDECGCGCWILPSALSMSRTFLGGSTCDLN